MAIQPAQAIALKEAELKKKYDSTISAIEAGIDDQIRKWDGTSPVKYHTDKKNLVYYVTQQLTIRFHGWSVVFETKDNRFTGWITLTEKKTNIVLDPKPQPWKYPDYDYPWGGPYVAPKRNPYDPYPKVTW